VGGADKKWKGNFWFCFAASDYEMNNLILTFLFALFSIFAARRGASSRRLVVTLDFVASFTGRGNSKNMDCAKAQANLIVLAPPALCAHKSPPFLGNIIKRRGLLPLQLFRYVPVLKRSLDQPSV